MPFASPQDLLIRTNAEVLASLSVPTDQHMPATAVLRAVIEASDLATFTEEDQAVAALALNKINVALTDAQSIITSYGIDESVQNAALKRIACVISLHYLRGEHVTEESAAQYQACIQMLDKHAKGMINLTPADSNATSVETEDDIVITSGKQRYHTASDTDDF